MPSMHVLVLDDELALREILGATVVKAGYSVDLAGSVKEAAGKLARGDVDVALCDIKLPDGSGIDLVRDALASGIDTAFVMVTAYGSMETAVEALRAGASDYIVKPVRSEEVLHRLAQIAAVRGLREENRELRKAVNTHSVKLYPWDSPRMRELERMVSRVAPTDSTVLITGESGTGKGVVARTIHEQSARRDGLFVVVNCSAIPEHLLESEFFGHTKGAFTSADRARKGLFLQADRGTLFLDEIGELPLHMQTKLLHVIEDKIVRPIGSEQARRVDTRIVAATNRDLQGMVTSGKFREDLFFRLSVFNIDVPPLRERQGDIRGLIGHLLDKARNAGDRSRPVSLDPGVEEALLGYAWPGNVRQVENVISRALILAEGDVIALGDLPLEITRSVALDGGVGTRIAESGYLRDRLRKFEADAVRCAVEEAGGDRRLAAQRLGIGLSSLYRKLEESEREGLLSGMVPNSPLAER
ncbi:MAG: sigma-54-dependent Fis family transcriptional regulator [Betaproteobacteria bacterium]|nr:sigma-54-dependent Fis family transcriptional regulator [Betaproteobacteria bacterium]